MILDEETGIVYMNNRQVFLTKLESKLLLFLIKHKNIYVSIKEISYYIYGLYDEFNRTPINVLICRLNKKINPEAKIVNKFGFNSYKIQINY